MDAESAIYVSDGKISVLVMVMEGEKNVVKLF